MNSWFNRAWRMLILSFLLLALPLQSMAVVSVRVCCPNPKVMVAATPAQNAHPMQHDGHANHHQPAQSAQLDDAPSPQAHSPAQHDSTVLSDCASCPACHAVGVTVLPTVFTHAPALVLTLIDTPLSPYLSHIPEGLQRPPAVSLS